MVNSFLRHSIIDLRSDTLTLPTTDMLQTILTSQFGDSGRWDAERRGEDPTVNKLEDMAAKMMGKEAAAFCNSGTMGNNAALLTHCRPGDLVLVDEQQHLYRTEKGAFSPRFGQLKALTYRADKDGNPDVNDISELLRNNSVKLVCVENTHNNRGGLCLPISSMQAVYEAAHRHNAQVHLDGARIFNAAAALQIDTKELAQYADSVMFCVSKGLGAPVGSLVCGTYKFIYELRETRRFLGGDMRQSGILAAPAIYALQSNITRLRKDNKHASTLTSHLHNLRNIHCPEHADSNIIMLTVPTGRAEELQRRLREHRIIGGIVDDTRVRLVFHQEISDTETQQIIAELTLVDKEMSR
ncbi:threonine aldolase family protein [Pyramidobacter piscolens]|uniref:threonine aldolase family protein n=1 Tax=Pyramidobacter piscolens TaxID=638849 RepID=UPI0026E0A658|nr:threonine aldolase family protein [Pyramidobacter piscolens]